MCGICGLVSLREGSAVDVPALRAMRGALLHRGPDSHGEFVEGGVGLAMQRLAIIDIAGGEQPVTNERGTVQLVQNGEIYNHRELRAALERQGHHFATSHSDTEMLVHLYEQQGLAFTESLRGMFAIALWDAAERRLVLARDPFGIKPLYYRVADGVLAFASEIGSLRHAPGFSGEIDHDALAAYLAFNSIPAPYSIHAGVRKLPAGHVLTFDADGVRVVRYARPAPVAVSQLRGGTFEALADDLLVRLRDSVRAHLVSDVPVGVLLSGGVDSGALAALAAQESGARVSTFSVGFEDSSFDELARARLVARRYDTDHHELILRPNAVELLPQIVRAFDEPFADSSALPTYLVSQLAAEHVKVVLSGEGADELFGGYYTYVADLLALRAGWFAALAGPLVERLPSSSRKASFDYKAKRFVRSARLPPLERHHGWKEIFSADARAELAPTLQRPATADPLDLLRRRYAETAGAEQLARLQDVDLGVYLVDDLLVKTDRASMAHSLEARVPFLDRTVAELALALPRSARVRGFAKKRLLRRAVESLLPREIVHGRKHGFSIPAAAWLRGELAPFAREVLSPAAVRRQGFFDPAVVTRLLDRHVTGAEDHSRQLWSLISFALWYDGSQQPAGRPPALPDTVAGPHG